MARNGTTSIRSSLIVGYGEIGQGLHKVIGGDYLDIDGRCEYKNEPYDIMHVCFPYSKTFKEDVEMYMDAFEPKRVVVHSTVPVGTCDSLGVAHSPVRGVHPHIDKGIRTFVKYVGGKGAKEIAKWLGGFGIKAQVAKSARDTEALKLWDTTQYGVMILLNKEIKRWCQRHRVDFDLVYSHANRSYNDGYRRLGREEVVRPSLRYMEGPIGGHCVVPNSKLFNSFSPAIIRWFDRLTRN